jgi:carbon-monoxide dehydrogenase iron sulfur subunit
MPLGFEIDPEKCTECQRCMAVCSQIKLGAVRLGSSRISIERRWPEVPLIRVCRFDDCPAQPCIEACPVEAISRGKTGLVLIDAETCTGCGACIEACPFEAIWMDEGRAGASGLAFKCDFCGGSPACVQECATGALAAKDKDSAKEGRR